MKPQTPQVVSAEDPVLLVEDDPILIVEDDRDLREALVDTLSLAGHQTLSSPDGPHALKTLSAKTVSLVISDVQMGEMDGHELLRQIKRTHPDLPVVLMTAYGTIEQAVDAMRDGACDYLVKPFEAQDLLSIIDRWRQPPPQDTDTHSPVAADPLSRKLLSLARRVARSDVTVLLAGESGTGKEVYARYIHRCSPRHDGPFVAINCAAIPENMLEAVLFGHEKGAFTGAVNSAAGKFEQAQGGTLLLDEISEMSLALQSKLLRVLQEREVERVGGKHVIKLDVRVLATTNRQLKQEVAEGRFREDLYYRLSVMPVHLSPLRDRPGDIVPLAQHLIAQHSTQAAAPRLTQQAQQALLEHPWRGNVRELDNLIQRTLVLLGGEHIDAADLLLEGIAADSFDEQEADELEAESDPGLQHELKDREHHLILTALREGGSRKAIAERLGISPRTLRYKIAKMREAGVAIPHANDAQVA